MRKIVNPESLSFYVYRHIRIDKKEVFYIGMGSYQKKWKYDRANKSQNRNTHWHNIVNLCNGEFIVEIMFDGITRDQAIEKEIEFIKYYGRSDLKLGTLCNLRDGGQGGFNLSIESRKKIGDSNRGIKSAMYDKKHTQERNDFMRKRMTGANNHNYGKKLPEWQAALNRTYQLGNIQSKETIEKRVCHLRKKVINVITGELYGSIKEASEFIGVSRSSLGKKLSGRKKNNTNFIFH